MAAKSTSTKKTGWLRENWLAVTLCSLVILVVGGFIYFGATAVSGEEINIRNLTVRKFHFRRDPFTDGQLTGITYSSPSYRPTWVSGNTNSTIDPQIVKHLDSQTPNRWDLVDFESTFPTGDALILVDLLSARAADGSEYWVTWSLKNGKKADIFWPAVQQLASSNLYHQMPSLFQMASVSGDLSVDEYHESVKAYLKEAHMTPSPATE